MYVYQDAFVMYRPPSARVEQVDVSAMSIKQLLRTYLEVFVVVHNTVLDEQHTLRLTDVSDLIMVELDSTTVVQWLADNGNQTLPTTKGTPSVKKNTVLFRDAWQAGYTADRCVPFGSPFNEGSDGDKTNIWLTRDDTDYINVQRHCLATVNGLVHRLDADENGLYIVDGGMTFGHSGNAFIGLMSFNAIGRVTTYDITPEMVYQPNPSRLLSDQFYVNLPFDTTGKVVGIVIGGYLHLNTSDISTTGARILRVDAKRIPLLERYMETRYIADMSAMERFHRISETNEHDYNLQNFMSNESMLELLSMSQSFIVAIDVESLYTDIVQTARTGLPGRFYSDIEPIYPLRTALGLFPSFIKSKEADTYVIRIDNNLIRRRLFNTAESEIWDKVDEKCISAQPAVYHRGDLVLWSNDRVVIS